MGSHLPTVGFGRAAEAAVTSPGDRDDLSGRRVGSGRRSCLARRRSDRDEVSGRRVGSGRGLRGGVTGTTSVTGKRPARPPLPAICDLDRAPPPPIRSAASPPSARPGNHPPPQRPPSSDRPAQRWPSQPVRGAPGHPRHGISSAKNGSADFGGLKIDPTKLTSLPFLHQKVRRLFLGRY